MARGYLNDEDPSSQKFLPSSEWIRSTDLGKAASLCIIGDLARYNSDGTICLLSRVDTMAKIRGQRFEPDEVETRYRQILPQKRQAVVEVIFLQEDEMPKLAAFVALEHAYSNGRVDSVLLMETGRALQDFASALPRIKAELSTSLPSYMQPST